MRSKILVSAKVLCYVNGQLFGRVTSFRWDSTTPRKDIYGLDSSEPYELAPTTTRLGGTIGLLRQSGDGGIEGPGLAALPRDLSREKYFTLALVDRTTDTVIFRANECSSEGQVWDLPSRGVMTGSLSFKGLIWSNESERIP